MRRILAAGLTLLTVTALATPTTAAPETGPKQATLTNFASLPAETYLPGSEPSGANPRASLPGDSSSKSQPTFDACAASAARS